MKISAPFLKTQRGGIFLAGRRAACREDERGTQSQIFFSSLFDKNWQLVGNAPSPGGFSFSAVEGKERPLCYLSR